jgi:anti-sigma factor RsiW
MRCEEVRDQFTDYVSGQIEEPARSAIGQHLAACEGCRNETEDLKKLWTTLGSIPETEPGPELRSRFHIMLEAYRQGMDNAPQQKWWHGWYSRLTGWWPPQPALQLGFALALLILGVVIGRQFQVVSTVPAVAPAAEVAELRAELSQTRQLVAISLMQQQSANDRLRGVNWSYQLQQPGMEILTALLDALMHDPNVNVRLATIDALRQFGDQPVVRLGVVEAMARQESPMVQIALIDLAVDLREKESVPALRKLTEDQTVNETVRERALRRLSEME